MASKTTKKFEIDPIGEIVVTKRSSAKRIKLSIRDNTPVISIPRYLPFKTGLMFAIKNKEWIEKHSSAKVLLGHDTRIGKTHTIKVLPTDAKLSARVTKNEIIVRLPSEFSLSDVDVQDRIKKASFRALKSQIEELLAERVPLWEETMQQQARKVKTKRLTSRWGSCSSDRTLTFSIYMAQLSNELIDYIIVHELTHIEHMNHSNDFWGHVGKFIPNYKELRAQLKEQKLELVPKL